MTVSYGSHMTRAYPGYGDTVVASHLNDLLTLGYDVISEFEAMSGRITFLKFVDGEFREVTWGETCCPSDIALVKGE